MKQVKLLILTSWLIMATFIFGGCHTPTKIVTEYRDRYTVKVDTFMQKDSLYFRDSIRVIIKGDTVTTDRWHYGYKDRVVYKNKIDTVLINDTIKVEVAHEDKSKASVWSKISDWFWSLIIASIIIYTLISITKWLLRK